MSEKKNLLTYEGLKKLEDELQDLKVVQRKEIAQKIKRQESRATCLRTPSTTQPRTNSVTSRPESSRSRRS